jgi:purine-binding chemotaxis protein CheW
MGENMNSAALIGEVQQLVSFKIGDEEFGVDILRVQEINRMISVTRVPNAPPFVEGIINLRGKVIPIVELRKRLGMEPRERDNNTRIVVVDVNGRTIGFIVDAVNEVLRVPTSVIEPPPALTAGIDAEFITAIGKLEDRLLILLDLERVLSTDEKSELEAVAA